MNGGTNIALSIKQAGQLLRGEDRDTARIVVLLTDGRVDSFQGVPWPGLAVHHRGMVHAARWHNAGGLHSEMRKHGACRLARAAPSPASGSRSD